MKIEEDKTSVELKEIIRLINIVNNPSYIHLENAEFEVTILILYEREGISKNKA